MKIDAVLNTETFFKNKYTTLIVKNVSVIGVNVISL